MPGAWCRVRSKEEHTCWPRVLPCRRENVSRQESQLSKPRMSVTKRQREQKKRDRQQKKAEKKALRIELKGQPEGSEIEETETVSEIS